MQIRIYSENSIIDETYLAKTIVVAISLLTLNGLALFSAHPVSLYNN